ncbi:unnamed protein product [Cochlearia groenlandica]
MVCECYEEHVDDKKGKNTSPSPITAVIKVDMHCDGCIAKIISLARGLKGVETVRADPASNKLTLIGFMDPVKITEKLQKKSKKKIELLSPKPKKEAKANNDPKPENNKNNNKTMVAVSTVLLKLNCSCDGCTKKIHKTISKTKGVYEVKMDKEKEVVTVTGTMDTKAVTENLKRKLKKTVQVLPEKKKNKNKNKEENSKGNTKEGCQGLNEYGNGITYGLGPYGYIEGPVTGFFSHEDQSFCNVM